MFNSLTRKSGGWAALHRLDQYHLADQLVPRLEKFLRETQSSDLELGVPNQLARALNLTEAQTLRLIALAAHENLFDVRWLVRCPHCEGTGPAGVNHQLGGYPKGPVECVACQGLFEVHADHTLHLHFRPKPSLRAIPETVSDWEYQRKLAAQWGLTPAWSMLNLEEFRTYLADLNLPTGQSIGVRVQTFWFTDLRASTAMYERLGDSTAFELVRRHYDVIFEAAHGHGGYAVKTIGDGTMGNFGEPAEALRAAAEAVRGVAALQAADEHPLRLRVGVHTGPCIVVALNSRLDFFGTTVNTTARLETQASGEDVVVSEMLLNNPAARKAAEALGPIEAFPANLRGLSEPQTLYRIKVV